MSWLGFFRRIISRMSCIPGSPTPRNRQNRILKIHGPFWQREYYDHLLRSEAEFERAVRYVLNNPVKAHLRNWEWVWVRGQGARATAGEGAGATI